MNYIFHCWELTFTNVARRLSSSGIRPTVDAPSHLSLQQSVSSSAIRDIFIVYHVPHTIITFRTIISRYYTTHAHGYIQPDLSRIRMVFRWDLEISDNLIERRRRRERQETEGRERVEVLERTRRAAKPRNYNHTPLV